MSKRVQVSARVFQNQSLCREHWRMVLGAASFPLTMPGQFVQIACRDMTRNYSPEREADWEAGQVWDVAGRELMAPLSFLRRPFSLGGRRDTSAGVELDIIYRGVGHGTRWLSTIQAGESVDLLGPMGNGFQMPAEGQVALLVGGGVGIPPMLYMAGALMGKKAVAFCGATTRDLLPLTVTADALAPSPTSAQPLYNIAEFSRHGIPAVITTDDGSYGYKGYVTDALVAYLDKYLAGGSAMVYTCGPEIMMKRVAQIAAERGIECQVAVERSMACGMGTCQSCVIRVRNPSAPAGWVYKLACTDGPVFRGTELAW